MRSVRLLPLLLALAVGASAQPVPLDSLARAYADEHGLPSLVLGVVPDEGLAVVVLTNRTGVADALAIEVLGRVRTARWQRAQGE